MFTKKCKGISIYHSIVTIFLPHQHHYVKDNKMNIILLEKTNIFVCYLALFLIVMIITFLLTVF